MRSMLGAALSVLLAAVLAAPAVAKGPIDLCGPNACARLAGGVRPGAALEADAPIHSLPAAPPGPYYELRFAGTTKPFGYWIPQSNVLRLQDGFSRGAVWIVPGQDESAVLLVAASGLPTFAAPTAARAWVNGREVRSARGYLDLLVLGAPVTSAPGAKGWLSVYVTSRDASPWTDGADSLSVSRRGGFLRRDGQVMRIPPALARRIRSRQPLRG